SGSGVMQPFQRQLSRLDERPEVAELRHTMLSRRSGEPATSERRRSTRRRPSIFAKAAVRNALSYR
ncbi:hypothetical protein, partial [Burkholderia sp. Bp8984]|uniref:hypothetical protein n=1 Tax=Burkholderia sp. Bp8984 TaxID=2184549 RepID=UPI001C8980EB